DTAGWQALGIVNVLINNALDGRRACYIGYAVQSSTLFLVDDVGHGGGPFAGTMAINSPGGVSNSQCAIAGSGSSVSANGNVLTITLNITFSAGFSGNKIVYLAARDTGSGNSGWQALGTWNVPGPVPSGPAVVGMSPARSTSAGQTYTFT